MLKKKKVYFFETQFASTPLLQRWPISLRVKVELVTTACKSLWKSIPSPSSSALLQAHGPPRLPRHSHFQALALPAPRAWNTPRRDPGEGGLIPALLEVLAQISLSWWGSPDPLTINSTQLPCVPSILTWRYWLCLLIFTHALRLPPQCHLYKSMGFGLFFSSCFPVPKTVSDTWDP